jgi:hypothetical protein
MAVAEQPFGCSHPVSSLELPSHSTTIRNTVAHATAAAIRVGDLWNRFDYATHEIKGRGFAWLANQPIDQPSFGCVSLKLCKACIFAHQSGKPSISKTVSLSGVRET